MIRGTTRLIAHIGYPTEPFRSPLIYNPYFEQAGIDAVVVPMGCRAEHYPAFLASVFTLTNVLGALITMPHKVSTVALLQEASAAVRVAGACNAVRRAPDGRLQGDLFDGEGFVRGMRRKGRDARGERALVVGCGGVGSAIAASLAQAGAKGLVLHDVREGIADQLAGQLRTHYPALDIVTGSADPEGCGIVVNATPLGLQPQDPLPVGVARIPREAFVGDVVMADAVTPFLAAAAARGCLTQPGTDMLFEQIPAYLEYFGLPVATPEALRAVARIA